MQKPLTLFIALLMATVALAQPKKEWYDHEGTITLPDNTVKKGIIRVWGSSDAPWEYQSGIRFIEADVWAKLEKVKRKDWQRYQAKDLISYTLADQGQTFVSNVRFALD